MTKSSTIRKLLHQLFEISVVLKGIYGSAEIVLGLIILFFSRHLVTHFLLFFVQGELNENPHDWIANQILHLSGHITASSELFMGIYFLTNGLIKLVLVTGLFLERAWAYPSAIAFMSAFGVYEIYRYLHTYSPVLVVLIILDIATIFLVWDEYNYRRK
ncbi:DUF2127 domain-containing protein [Candidatus Kaiserbacteria bacterium]|nr:DUF2127 domain-containing protein [Candidatus Kaiserbacteria bacterium]